VCEGTPSRVDLHYSKKYVESILSQLPSAQLHLSTPVHAVWSGEGNVILETATGIRDTFDHIIFGCHSDDALRILDAGSGATPAEREVLGAFRWSRNEVWLHTDENVSPHSPLVLEGEMEPDGWAYQLNYAAFARRMILLELYHMDNRGWAREDESKRPTGIIVSSVLLPLPSRRCPAHRLTHPLSVQQNMYATMPLSLSSILPQQKPTYCRLRNAGNTQTG
jgi:hypothetical protein